MVSGGFLIAPTSPFIEGGGMFTVPLASSGRIYIEDGNPGGDNVGPILDTVESSDSRASTLPEPGHHHLLALGGVAVTRRKRE